MDRFINITVWIVWLIWFSWGMIMQYDYPLVGDLLTITMGFYMGWICSRK